MKQTKDKEILNPIKNKENEKEFNHPENIHKDIQKKDTNLIQKLNEKNPKITNKKLNDEKKIIKYQRDNYAHINQRKNENAKRQNVMEESNQISENI